MYVITSLQIAENLKSIQALTEFDIASWRYITNQTRYSIYIGVDNLRDVDEWNNDNLDLIDNTNWFLRILVWSKFAVMEVSRPDFMGLGLV